MTWALEIDVVETHKAMLKKIGRKADTDKLP
jgi:hypothetical protein